MDITFTLQSLTDGSPLLGKAGSTTVYISKDGGAYAATSGSVAEIGRGSYKVSLTTTESDFTSQLLYQPVCTGAQTQTWGIEPPITVPTAAQNAAAVWSASGRSLTTSVTVASFTTAGTTAISAAVWSASSSYANGGSNTMGFVMSPQTVASAVWADESAPTVPTTTQIAHAVWGRQTGTTRSLTESPTDISSLATASALSTVSTNVTAIKNKTDNLPASPAAVGSAMTLTAAYDAAKTAASATNLDKVLASVLNWAISDDTLTLYNNSNQVLATYTITTDSADNIVKVEPST